MLTLREKVVVAKENKPEEKKMEFMDFVFAVEHNLPRDLGFHRIGRDEIQVFVLDNWSEIRLAPDAARWATDFRDHKLEQWRRYVSQMKQFSHPLLPDSDIPAFLHRGCDDKAISFAHAFTNAWENILSADARGTVLAYWSTWDVPASVELTREYDWTEAPAKTCLRGFHLCFDYGRIFGSTRSDGLHIAIAHELGHVLCYATKDTAHMATVPEDKKKLKLLDDAREAAVGEVLKGWNIPEGVQDAALESFKPPRMDQEK